MRLRTNERLLSSPGVKEAVPTVKPPRVAAPESAPEDPYSLLSRLPLGAGEERGENEG